MPSKNRPAPLSDAVFRAKLEARQPPIGDGRPTVPQEIPVHNTFIQFASPEGQDDVDAKAQMSTAPAWIGPSFQSMIQSAMSSSTQATTPEEPKIPPPAAPVGEQDDGDAPPSMRLMRYSLSASSARAAGVATSSAVVVGGQDEDQTPPPGELPSMGSAKHHEGLCKRCCFYPKGRCSNGYDCEFCHFDHEKRKRKKKKKGSKNKAEADGDSESDEENEEGGEENEQEAKQTKPPKPAKPAAKPTPAPLQGSPRGSAGPALMTPSTASSMPPGWQDAAFTGFPSSAAAAAVPLGASSYEAAIWGAPPERQHRGGMPLTAPPTIPPAMPGEMPSPETSPYTNWLASQQAQAQGSFMDPYYSGYGQAQPASIPPGMSGMDPGYAVHPQLSPSMYGRPGAEPRLSTYSPFAPQGAAAQADSSTRTVPAAPPPAPPGYAPAMPQAPPAAQQSSSAFSAAGRPAPR